MIYRCNACDSGDSCVLIVSDKSDPPSKCPYPENEYTMEIVEWKEVPND